MAAVYAFPQKDIGTSACDGGVGLSINYVYVRHRETVLFFRLRQTFRKHCSDVCRRMDVIAERKVRFSLYWLDRNKPASVGTKMVRRPAVNDPVVGAIDQKCGAGNGGVGRDRCSVKHRSRWI